MHVRLKNERTLHLWRQQQNHLPRKTRAAQRIAVRVCQSLSVLILRQTERLQRWPIDSRRNPQSHYRIRTPLTLRVFESQESINWSRVKHNTFHDFPFLFCSFI